MRYVIFGKKQCPYCVKAEALLEERGEKIKVVNFEPDQDVVLQEIKNAYEWPTVPMIFEVNDSAAINFIGGYTDLVNHFNG